MIVGGLIYLLWRSEDMLMFYAAETLGLREFINHARIAIGPAPEWIPDIILFSLPDAVWVYSGTSFFSRLWRGSNRLVWASFTSVFTIAAVGSEVGQLFGIVPGTFDIIDVAVCLLAGWLGYRIST